MYLMEGYTNVCEATSQSHDMDCYRPTHRKGKKLLAEKKRRARINNCLMQIRDIVCHGEEAKDSDIDKMEKAEILEKTLEVLTKVRNDYDGTRNSLSSNKAMAVRYASGFSSCAEESIRYIQCSRLIPTEVKHQLQAHLRSIAHRMESSLSDASLSYEHPNPSPLGPMSTPVSSLPASQLQEPSTSSLSSSSRLLPLSGNTSSTSQISPCTRLDFQDPTQNIAITAPTFINVKPDSTEGKVKIPSPIRSSTPIVHVEDREMIVIPSVPHGYQNNQSNFSPITAHDFALEHKENHPNDSSYLCAPASYSQDRKIFSSQGNSAFYRCTPRSLSSSSPKEQLEVLSYHQPLHTSSSSSSSTLPTVLSEQPVSVHSQYSPVSPATSPISTTCSMTLVVPQSLPANSLQEQQIFQYHGYEPYPILPVVTSSVPSSCAVIFSETSAQPTILNLSQTTPSTTSSNALDLCIKRNESHNISPETMWRPW